MSIAKSTDPGQVPNWLDHPWTPDDRLHWLQTVLAFSPRDWSKYPYATPGHDDPEAWAVYCLVMYDRREDALENWNRFCFPDLYPDDDTEEQEDPR